MHMKNRPLLDQGKSSSSKIPNALPHLLTAQPDHGHAPAFASPSPPLLSPTDPPDRQGPKLPDPIPSPLIQSYSRRTGPARVEARRPAPTKRSGSERAGSQRELADEEARFVYINDPARTNQPVRFPDNSIRTAKYSVLSFLPRNLFEQFHRVAYVYFLILAGLNQVPQLGVFSPVASVLRSPSCSRHRRQGRLRGLAPPPLRQGRERPRRSRLLRRRIRAQALEGGSGGGAGARGGERDAAVRHGGAVDERPDGRGLRADDQPGRESNLKTRYARQETQAVAPHAMAGTIRCERPNRNIYGFHANLDLGGKRVSLGPSNIILRGCELKNTAWALGVAVYTGKDTKVMLNSSGAPSKRSRLEAHMNRETILLAVALVALCTIVSALAGAWLHTHRDELDDMPFYRKRDFSGREPDNYEWYGIGWEIAFTFMSARDTVPGAYPHRALHLHGAGAGGASVLHDTGPGHVRREHQFQVAVQGPEHKRGFGQIKYVFSDKTGTLTENKMEFRCASVQGWITVAAAAAVMNMVTKNDCPTDPELRNLLRAGTGYKARRACDFFLALATCNTIVPIEVDTSDPSVKLIDYQGSHRMSRRWFTQQQLMDSCSSKGLLVTSSSTSSARG
uniref:P-type ATPase N-terminal domain-containing protein n=1 Tax=Ananas comosus var. bracteatus TaxID=296719 RepID=A0A6V7PR13_ANACO|nr:unnamed protein product [Ananas comosus var. bracteatus]